MAAISEHLNHRPYQVAVSNDADLPRRKWNHLGTFYNVSARSVEFMFYNDDGTYRDNKGSNYKFIRIDFGA